MTGVTGAATAGDQIRVMIVDDSAIVRGLVSRWLEEEQDFAVVATHRHGRLAAQDMTQSRPDVVILDIEMPEMDGLTALPLLLKAKPDTVVLVASTLSQRGAETSLRALALGAADYVPKPDPTGRLATSADFRRELVEKVRHLGQRVRTRSAAGLRLPLGAPAAKPATPAPAPATPAFQPRPQPPRGTEKLRPYTGIPARVLCIGSSTGGPQALMQFLQGAGQALARLPVLIVQHMPPTFTTILAQHLGRTANREAAEGVDGEPLAAGRIYVAPGGRHMLVEKVGEKPVIRLSDAPPVHFCRPAVDPMFESVARVFGSAALGVILTGMGSDGAKGALAIADAGGNVIAQNEATSVVWGMPGAAIAAGACAGVLPIEDIGPRVSQLIVGGRA